MSGAKEGLTHETSALETLRWPIFIVNSVDKTKFIWLYSLTDAAPQFLQKLTPFTYCSELRSVTRDKERQKLKNRINLLRAQTNTLIEKKKKHLRICCPKKVSTRATMSFMCVFKKFNFSKKFVRMAHNMKQEVE